MSNESSQFSVYISKEIFNLPFTYDATFLLAVDEVSLISGSYMSQRVERIATISPQQCKKDLYNCFKDGKDKKGCLKDYGACVDALIPPFVVSESKTMTFYNQFYLFLAIARLRRGDIIS